MANFDDMMDWIIDKACHVHPFNDFVDCYNSIINEPGYNGWLQHVKMNQSTHDAICDQTGIRPILTLNGLTVIISESLPDNVYKFV